MLAFGIYHRNESDTQTAQDAANQVATSEIWGRVPRNGILPTVQAYTQNGVRQDRRIEFSTDAKPRMSPFEVRWYLGDAKVLKREKGGEEFACIQVAIHTNYQI